MVEKYKKKWTVSGFFIALTCFMGERTSSCIKNQQLLEVGRQNSTKPGIVIWLEDGSNKQQLRGLFQKAIGAPRLFLNDRLSHSTS